ncbi:MAG: GNAT family N-acetyltransferase [Candidatus Lokiarchaeota archaeon]|nr:GNAT family N-acetyltransferase [Candidatus Lokiarchaeota archaeon]
MVEDLKKRLQRIAASAWPAKEMEQYGGWLLRANNGITSRANSVFPEDNPPAELEEAIEYAISFYMKRSIEPQFQLTHFTKPSNLDEALDARGFTILMPTQVQIANIDDILKTASKNAVEVSNEVTDEWIEWYQNITGKGDYYIKIRRSIMERIPPPKILVWIRQDERITSLAMGVLREDWVGLFSVTTDPNYRRTGGATAVTRSIADWAKRHGAKKAYLQVESDNAPALAMYQKLGFTKFFDYWYRTLEV